VFFHHSLLNTLIVDYKGHYIVFAIFSGSNLFFKDGIGVIGVIQTLEDDGEGSKCNNFNER
jgi:hypothetical protein